MVGAHFVGDGVYGLAHGGLCAEVSTAFVTGDTVCVVVHRASLSCFVGKNAPSIAHFFAMARGDGVGCHMFFCRIHHHVSGIF